MVDNMTEAAQIIENQGASTMGAPHVIDAPVGSACMFFDRCNDLDHIEDWIFSQNKRSVLITGSGGVGKTSMLLQLQDRCARYGGRPVWLDFAEIVPQIQSDESLYFHIVKAVLSEKPFRRYKEKLIRKKGLWKNRLAALVRACAKDAAPGRLVFLCDDAHLLAQALAEGRLSASALDWMAEIDGSLSRQERVCWVLAGDQDVKETLGDAFSTDHAEYKIPLFSEKKAWELIAATLTGEYAVRDAGLIPMIHRLSGGHPLYIRHICHALDARGAGGRRRAVIGRKDLLAAVEGMVEKPFLHMLKSWHGLSWKNRALLTALANSVRTPGDYVCIPDIDRAVRKSRYPLTPAEFSQAAADLVRADLVDYDPEGNALRMNPDLLRQWIVSRRKAGTELDRRRADGRAGRPARPRRWKFAAAVAAIAVIVSGVVLFSHHIVNARTPGADPAGRISRVAD